MILTVGILTLGLTATVAVVTYINGFYQPFPGVDASGLYQLFGNTEESPYLPVSYLDFEDYAKSAKSFKGITASASNAASVRHTNETEVAFVEAVSGNFFSVLEVPTLLGRGIRPEDDVPGAPAVAVLSHAWWSRSFAGSKAVIGQTIYLNYRPFIVVGVCLPEFLGTPSSFRPDVWIPIQPFRDRYVSWTARAVQRDVPLVRVYARLVDGVTPQRAFSELAGIASGLDETYPRQDEPRRLRLEKATWIDPASRLGEMPTIRLMVIAVTILLLLVCANTSNLLLALARGREREINVRAVLGASPAGLLRLVLIETTLIAGTAGVISLLLAGPASSRLGSYFARPSVWGENVAR